MAQKFCYTCKSPLGWINEPGVGKYGGYYQCPSGCKETFERKGGWPKPQFNASPKPQNRPITNEKPQDDRLSVAIEMMAKLDILIRASKAILQETNPEAYDEVFKGL